MFHIISENSQAARSNIAAGMQKNPIMFSSKVWEKRFLIPKNVSTCLLFSGTLTRDAAELSRALTARAVMVSRLACRPWDVVRQQ